MLFYDVKLINPQTKKVYFHKVGKKPDIPPKDVMEKFQGAMLVITMTTSLLSNDVDLDSDKKAS